MAIDTEQKRKSAATNVAYWNAPSIVPGGGFSEADRKHISWTYSGITITKVIIAVKFAIDLYIDKLISQDLFVEQSQSIDSYIEKSQSKDFNRK